MNNIIKQSKRKQLKELKSELNNALKIQYSYRWVLSLLSICMIVLYLLPPATPIENPIILTWLIVFPFAYMWIKKTCPISALKNKINEITPDQIKQEAMEQAEKERLANESKAQHLFRNGSSITDIHQLLPSMSIDCLIKIQTNVLNIEKNKQ